MMKCGATSYHPLAGSDSDFPHHPNKSQPSCWYCASMLVAVNSSSYFTVRTKSDANCTSNHLWNIPLQTQPVMKHTAAHPASYETYHCTSSQLWNIPLHIQPVMKHTTANPASYETYRCTSSQLWNIPLRILTVMKHTTAHPASYETYRCQIHQIIANVRTGIQWTTLFCVYFVMCGLIVQWPSKFNASIHRLIGGIFFVTKCIVKWAVIWWNLSSFEHLHFLIYPKCTFVRITAFSLLSMNNYTVL